MSLGNPIQLRLSPEAHAIYEEEARRQKKPLAVYIRDRLEREDALRAELIHLRNRIEDVIDGLRHDLAEILSTTHRGPENGQGQANPADRQSLIELLLLSRANTPPDRMAMIHAELRRLGFEPWTYKAEKP